MGKTTVCKILQEKYGLNCKHVPDVCFGEGMKHLEFEVYALARIAEHMNGGENDVLDESPLTVALYVRAIPLFLSDLVTDVDVYEEAMRGAIRYAKYLKDKGAKLVWLTAEKRVIMGRLKKSENACEKRTFLDALKVGRLGEAENILLKELSAFGLPDLVIDTTQKTPEEVADEVMKLVNKDRGNS